MVSRECVLKGLKQVQSVESAVEEVVRFWLDRMITNVLSLISGELVEGFASPLGRSRLLADAQSGG